MFIDEGHVAQSSLTVGQSGPLIQGAVTTSPPTYTTGQTMPLSLNTSGQLRVEATFSGSITIGSVDQGNPNTLANAWPIKITDGTDLALVTAGGALQVDGTGGTFPVTGTVTANQGTSPWVVTPFADTTSSGNITSTQSITISAVGMCTIGIQVTGSWTGTIVVEGSVDGSNFQSTTMANLTSGALVSSTTSNGAFQASCAGLQSFRLRGASVGTGTAVVTLRANATASMVMLDNPIPAGTNTIGNVNAIQSGTWNINVTELANAILADDSTAAPTTAPVYSFLMGLKTGGTQWARIESSPDNADGLSTTANGDLRCLAFTMGFNGSTFDRISAFGDNADGLATATKGHMSVLSHNIGFNGTTWDRLRSGGNNADAIATSSLGILGVQSYSLGWNGTTWDRLKSSTANGLQVDVTRVTGTVTISGTVTANQGGTWNINNISGTISLPTGAATETTLAKLPLAQGSTTSGQSGPLVQGAVTTAAPSYTTAQTSPLSLTTSGALRVDGSGSTQPVSGTVTANQGGTWNIGTVTTVTTVSTVTAVTSITNDVNVKQKPDATSTYAPTNLDSTALEASHVIKASSGVLYSLDVYNSDSVAYYILIFNSTTVPADTTAPTISPIKIAPDSNISLDYNTFGRFFSTGIAVCGSTTASTKTVAGAKFWFSARFA